MKLGTVPELVRREHGFPVSHETVQNEFGSMSVESPDGADQPLSVLLDTCSDFGFDAEYETADDLRTVLLCCADEAYVGRPGYDDRGSNPTRPNREQLSF